MCAHSLIEDIGKNEMIIICVFIVSLTAALIFEKMSETAYVGIMGSFVGYTFARIFNHMQGKEEIIQVIPK